MSYAIRNSLILLIVLLLFVGGGWGYIHYFQTDNVAQLQKKLADKKKELKQKQQVADQYQAITDSYHEASVYFNNYDKALYLNSNEDKVFDFLTTVNRGAANNDFSFSFSDSTVHPKYGVLNMNISGEGSYRNLVNFVRGIELSKPLNKIKNMTITPIQTKKEAKDGQDEGTIFNHVNYSFDLESYYYRTKILENPMFTVYKGMYASVHDPFFPLVRDVKANTEGQVNVEKSKLVALSTDRVFLVDQTGVMKQVHVGQKVYLGKLTSINLSKRTATFVLDKGGIVKSVTLEVHHENN